MTAADDLAARLAAFTFSTPEPPSPRRAQLHRSTVAVVHFDSADVTARLGAEETDPDLLAFLADDCQRTVGLDGLPHWTLVDAPRRATAVELGPAGLTSAVRQPVLPVPDHPVQRALTDWLGATPPPSVGDLDEERCRALQQVVLWFGPVVPTLPSVGETETRLAVLELERPLHELVGEFFRGRTELLGLIWRYVDGPPSTPPLALWGPGGVGKSTAVARFLLDRLANQTGFAYAYLNFDRAVLDPLLPRTVLIEATRQLGLQFPGRGAEEVRSALLDEEVLEGVDSISKVSDHKIRTDRDDGALRSFAKFAVDVVAGSRLVVVLDTFEEVQRRGESAEWTVLEYLDRVRALVPSLRVIVVGRSPVSQERNTVQLHQVGELDLAAATGYLTARVPDLTADEVTRVLREVGRNPLSLRLAAQLLLEPGVDRATALLSLHNGAVQGVLYRRVLDHIDDPRVRAIAHPGLVLRRITADVIASVLAVPCRLRLSGPADAQRLFHDLEREGTLVERRPEDPGALWHRADVRALVLRLVTDDAPERAASIHRRAVRYYHQEHGATARAEEMYHRLMLGQQQRTLLSYWDDDAAPMLYRSFDELPPQSKVFLAPRLGGDVADRLDAEIRAGADAADRAIHVRKRVLPMLAAGRITEALQEVTAARLPNGDPLVPDLEIEVREHAGDVAGALGLSRKHVARLRAGPGDRNYVDAVLTLAGLLEQTGAVEEAIVEVQRLLPLVAGDDMQTLRVDVTLLRLARIAGHDRQGLVTDTIGLAEGMGTFALSRDPALLRALGAEIGDRSDAVLAAAVRHVGLDLAAPGDVPTQLAGALTSFDAEVSTRLGAAPGAVFRELEKLPDEPVGTAELSARITAAGTRTVSKSIAETIDSYGSTAGLSDTLVQMYRERDARA